MRFMKAVLFLFVVGLTIVAQTAAPAQQQLTQVPPKPTCNPAALAVFGGGPDCQDRWNLYNQAVQQRTREELQLYVNRQKEQASAPLQQQITELNKLSTDQQTQIKKLQEQMQADSAAAVQAKAAAHTEGMEQGAGIGAVVMLLLGGGVFLLKKRSTANTQVRAASAAR